MGFFNLLSGDRKMVNLVPHLVSPADVIDPDELAAALAGKASTTHDHDASYMPKFVAAPATAGATGVAGTMAYDATNLYVCVATNTWVKCTIATWGE